MMIDLVSNGNNKLLPHIIKYKKRGLFARNKLMRWRLISNIKYGTQRLICDNMKYVDNEGKLRVRV